MARAIGLFVILGILLSGKIAAQSPLTIEEVVHFETLAHQVPIQVSPDGEWIAYTMVGARRTEGSTATLMADSASARTEIRITHTQTGESLRVMEPPFSSWAPSWSPDGTRLAFYANQGGAAHLWMWNRSTRRARRVSDAVIWTAWTRNVPRWTPDGTGVVVKLLPEGRTFSDIRRLATAPHPEPEARKDSTTVRVFRSEPEDEDASSTTPAWLRWKYGGDLAVLDGTSGSVQRLTTGQVPVWWDVSADGSRLAFVQFADPDRLADGFRLGVVPIPGGDVRLLPGVIRQAWGEAVSWAPHANRLAYITPGEGEDGGLFVANAETMTRRRLGDAPPGWAESLRGPRWSPDGTALYVAEEETVWRVDVETGAAAAVAEVPGRPVLDILSPQGTGTAWSPDGRALVVRIRNPATQAMGFARIGLASGRVETLVEENGAFGGFFTTDVARDGSTFVARFSSTRHAPDLWSINADLRRSRQLTECNPGFQPDRLGESRLVEWTTEDGQQLGGTLLLPPAYEQGTRVPLIVDVYGGDMGSRQLHRFDRHRQLLATRGVAVLAPDAPLHTGTPMRDHARTILPGVERVIEQGIADPDRLGVMGHSYGGYGTLALLVQTDMFGAAVASAGHGSMTGMFATLRPDGMSATQWAEHGQGRMGGTPWDVRERYIENSPFFFLDRVHTPLLLLHGAEETNTPVYLAEELFAALQRLERTVVLARYEGEGHWSGSWSAANQIDYWRRLVAWFDEHL